MNGNGSAVNQMNLIDSVFYCIGKYKNFQFWNEVIPTSIRISPCKNGVKKERVADTFVLYENNTKKECSRFVLHKSTTSPVKSTNWNLKLNSELDFFYL